MSYPPLKMLIIVALFLVIIENLPEWICWSEVIEEEASDGTIYQLAIWADQNPAWATLALCSLLILPAECVRTKSGHRFLVTALLFISARPFCRLRC